MRRLSPLDELLAHQIPEPITTAGIEHPHWRESYFFELHSPHPDGDVIALGFATYPQRQSMEAVLLGHVGGIPLQGRAERAWDGDPHTIAAGPVRITIERPFEQLHVALDGFEGLQADLTFTARTKPYLLRRGRLVDDNGLLIWDQSHMIQSGIWAGRYSLRERDQAVTGWVGQRDHSWGVRDHSRVPLWLWFAVQLPDGMLGAWLWETADGARVFTDGCWAPADGGEPVPVIDVQHALHWRADSGTWLVWEGHGRDVAGLEGRISFKLAGGREVEVTGSGGWAARYAPFHGGGLLRAAVTTGDGREGTAIFEVTGHLHHHVFPTWVPAG